MKTLKVNGQDIVYTDVNPTEKRVVVFVHGHMSSHKAWQVTVDQIQSGLRVITVDMRGFGNSTYNNPITLLDHMALDVTGLCDKLGIEKATFVGWSLGGLVVMKIAELRADLAYKIVLTCSVGHAGLRPAQILSTVTIPMEELKKNEEFKLLDQAIKQKNIEVFKMLFKLRLFTHVEERYTALADELAGVALQQRGFYDAIFVIMNPRIDITRIKAKVVAQLIQWLVLVGLQDDVVPLANIQPTIDELKRGNYPHRVRTFQKAAHFLPLEHSEEYVKVIREFVME